MWRGAIQGWKKMAIRLAGSLSIGMVSSGALTLAPSGAGTTVSWTNAGEFGGNPFMRYFGLMMDRMVGKDFDAGLNNLKQLAEKP